MTSIHGQPTIRTYSGLTFNFLWTTPDMIDVRDIAHSLSQVCRFAGQSRHFYSVAQHSVLVSKLVEGGEAMQFCALLHDASEAYIGDVSRPLKRHLSQYQEIEEGVMRAIARRFEIPFPLPKEVKLADNLALAYEGARFMVGGEDEFGLLPPSIKREASHIIARSLPPDEAKKLFMERFEELNV